MGPGMDAPAVVSDDGTPATGAFGGPPSRAPAARVKYLDEYRDPVLAKKLVAEIHRDHDAPVDAHGGLRRADPHDREAGDRRGAARRASG